MSQQYKVTIEHDGCHRAELRVERPVTLDEAVQLVSHNIAPQGYDFCIVNIDTGRAVSYMCKRVPRRTRLKLGHFDFTK